MIHLDFIERPRLRRFLILYFLGISLLSACGSTDSNDSEKTGVRVFAAAGTRLATEALCERFESAGHGPVTTNFASSGTLARQIASGAQADVFVSANKQWITFLKDKKLLSDDTVHKIAGNTLVVVAPKNRTPTAPIFENNFDIAAAIADRIAIGDPTYVPVGKYTKAAFDRLGWFEKVQDRTVMAKDVSAVLNYVALGEVDWGIVYRSEAMASDRVRIIATVPSALHNPIEFYVADLTSQNAKGRVLSEMFRSKEGLAIFLEHGFIEIPSTGEER